MKSMKVRWRANTIAIEKGKRSRLLVEIWRRSSLDKSTLIGYIVGYVPKKYILLHKMSDGIRLDGYVVIRFGDIVRITTKPLRAEFFKKVLKSRGYAPIKPKGIKLGDLRTILKSIDEAYPLLVIFREKISKDCAIGKIENLTTKTMRIYWLTPSARWEGLSPTYLLKDISMIGFDGEYEQALAIVAPPQNPGQKPS